LVQQQCTKENTMSGKEQLRSRASNLVFRLMLDPKRKTPVSKEIAEAAIGPITTRLLKNGDISMGSSRITITSAARKETIRTARSLGWMEAPQHHHGSEASKCAAKTLRALQRKAVDGEGLLELCVRFGQSRKRHIDSKCAKKSYAKERQLELPEHGVVARWLTSAADLDRVGHAMQNCLANEGFGQDYKRLLRKQEIELVALQSKVEPVALICAAAATRVVENVAGPSNKRPIAYRAAIIATLIGGDFHVEENYDCLKIAVCDELLDAHKRGTVKHFNFLKRECEIGEGFIAIKQDEDTVLLRSSDWEADMYMAHIESSDTGWVQQSATRNWLRKACRQNAEFAQACHDAFNSSHKAIRQDWFGLRRSAAS
jgi:hypothetical protein